MAEPGARAGPPPLWVCPTCGARLISRNLSHSCGRWTLEELFAGSEPGTLDLARRFVAMLEGLGDVQVLPQKTRLICVARVRFGGLLPRRRGFIVRFALRRRLDHPRIRDVEDYGPRWIVHRVLVVSAADLDDELHAWFEESYRTVGLQDDLYPSE